MSFMSGPFSPAHPSQIALIRPCCMLSYICALHHPQKIHSQEGYIMEPSANYHAIQDAEMAGTDYAPASPPPDPAPSAQFISPKPSGWSAFAEGPAADFFTGYKLDKMTLDDGSGNKAKFSRTRDGSIKVEYTSSVLL